MLANLLQYLFLNQASGCLSLRHPQGLQGQVYLQQGRVIHIDSGQMSDIAALSVLLTWEEGRFSFRSDVALSKNTLKISAESLLLEASYQADVVKSSEGGLLTPDSVWQASPLGGARARWRYRSGPST